eukprot:7712741-Alexandrium_andersonii.AAC.1
MPGPPLLSEPQSLRLSQACVYDPSFSARAATSSACPLHLCAPGYSSFGHTGPPPMGQVGHSGGGACASVSTRL